MATVNSWNSSSPPEVSKGGTGITSFTAYGLVVGNTTGTGPLSSVATGTANQILLSGGSSAIPFWTTTLTVPGGGTGKATLTTYALMCGGTGTTTPMQQVASVGTSGDTLISAGAGALPAFGTLGVIGGGSGRATGVIAYGVVCTGTTATGAQQTTASAGTSGDVLVSGGASALPAWAAPTQAATQANQETGTSTTTYVSPGRQQYHPSAAKAWLKWSYSTGTPTIDSSYNVTSLTDNGTGDLTVNYTTALSAAGCFNGTSSSVPGFVYTTSNLAASVRLVITDVLSVATDNPGDVMVFGDLP